MQPASTQPATRPPTRADQQLAALRARFPDWDLWHVPTHMRADSRHLVRQARRSHDRHLPRLHPRRDHPTSITEYRGPPTRAHRNRPHRTTGPPTARRPPQGPRTPARRHDPPPQPQPRRHRTRHPAITAASQTPARPSQPQPCLNSTPGETRPRGTARKGRAAPGTAAHRRGPPKEPKPKSGAALARRRASRRQDQQQEGPASAGPRTRRPPRAVSPPPRPPVGHTTKSAGPRPQRRARQGKSQELPQCFIYAERRHGGHPRARKAAPRASPPRPAPCQGTSHKARGKRRRLSGLGEKCAHPTPGPHRRSLPEPVK